MQPGDANVSGNVHGGRILQMIEEAGMIVSTRHCNVGMTEENNCICGLARVEHTDFLQPMFVGEIAHLHAVATYCSAHSIEVKVDVHAENLFKGEKRLTNQATLWYVPIKEGNIVCNVPPLVYKQPEDEMAGRRRYLKQKTEREQVDTNAPSMTDNWAMSIDVPNRNGEMHTVGNAQSSLIHLVGVQDCGVHGWAMGGVAMKLMDEVAGICAIRHCHTNVVTASMDAVDFHQRINKGSLLHVRGRPIFNSYKSLLIQVIVMVEQSGKNEHGELDVILYCACSAYFTFVSLSSERKTLPIPPLKLHTDDEKARFEEGQQRYKKQKSLRSAM
ncbi:cytosolic acyl coenzyme A thioester hydrolase-like isoform X2 [Clavelina lepadiformis]